MNMDLNIDGLPEDLLQHVAELAENKEIQAIIDKQVLNVHNMSMGGGSMVDLSGISGSSQMMSPMNNVIVQEISRPTKINGKFFDFQRDYIKTNENLF